MQDELESKVRQWIENSGRALELRVARAARNNGAMVQQSYIYTDPASNKEREGDVRAELSWTGYGRPCRLIVNVECKSARNKPWIAYYDGTPLGADALEDWTYFGHGPFVGLVEPLRDEWLGNAPFDDLTTATHMTAALGDGKENCQDPASDAIRQVLAAATAQQKEYSTEVRANFQTAGATIVIPVVVTGAPLYTCHLSDDGQEIELSRVRSVVVRVKRPDGRSSRLWVLDEEAFPSFIDSLASRVKDADRLLSDRR